MMGNRPSVPASSGRHAGRGEDMRAAMRAQVESGLRTPELLAYLRHRADAPAMTPRPRRRRLPSRAPSSSPPAPTRSGARRATAALAGQSANARATRRQRLRHGPVPAPGRRGPARTDDRRQARRLVGQAARRAREACATPASRIRRARPVRRGARHALGISRGQGPGRARQAEGRAQGQARGRRGDMRDASPPSSRPSSASTPPRSAGARRPAQGGRPARLSALAGKLGVTEAKLRDALQSLRPPMAGPDAGPGGRRDRRRPRQGSRRQPGQGRAALKPLRDELKQQRDAARSRSPPLSPRSSASPRPRSTPSSTRWAIMGGVVRSDPLVLVVDDEASVRQALERALRLEGFAVSTAAGGREALDAVAQRPPAVDRPRRDDARPRRRQRRRGACAPTGIDVPVCILSARDEVEDRVAGLQAGADDYLVKPFALAELTARLARAAAPPRPRRRRPARRRRPRRRPAPPRRHPRRARARPDPARVRAAGGLRPPPRAGALARPAPRAGLGLHDRRGDQRRRRLRRLSAPQARGSRRAAHPAHGPRRRLGAAAMRRREPARADHAGRASPRWRWRAWSPARCCWPRSSATAATRSTATCATAPSAPAPRERPRLRPRRASRASRCCAAAARSSSRLQRRPGRPARGDVPAAPPALPEHDGLRTVDDRRARLARADRHGRPAATRGCSSLTSLAPVEERVGRTRRLIVLIGLLALALTALAAWAFTSLAVRPLARLRAGAARVSGAEDLATPLPTTTAPTRCARSRARSTRCSRACGASRRTERALAATRRFAADAGHELRTPLTGLRANLDALARNPDLPAAQRDALVAEMTAEQDRIVHLLEGLQALARGEAAERLPREHVELGDLVDAAVFGARRRHPGVRYELAEPRRRRARSTAGRAGCGWSSTTCSTTPRCTGGRGGRVGSALERDDGQLRLRVEDDGPGIAGRPARRAARAVRPRRRARRAGGTGLGPRDRRPAGRAARRRAAAARLEPRRARRRGNSACLTSRPRWRPSGPSSRTGSPCTARMPRGRRLARCRDEALCCRDPRAGHGAAGARDRADRGCGLGAIVVPPGGAAPVELHGGAPRTTGQPHREVHRRRIRACARSAGPAGARTPAW